MWQATPVFFFYLLIYFCLIEIRRKKTDQDRVLRVVVLHLVAVRLHRRAARLLLLLLHRILIINIRLGKIKGKFIFLSFLYFVV